MEYSSIQETKLSTRRNKVCFTLLRYCGNNYNKSYLHLKVYYVE